MNDYISRILKTFVEGFFGVLVPQVVAILSNITDYSWSNWTVWLLPIICGAVGAGISAAWNGLQNRNKTE